MQLKITNGLGDEYLLDPKFKYTISPFTRRVNTTSRYGKSGGVVTGDEQVDVRDISLKYNILSENDLSYLDELNGLIGFFTPDDGPFYLVDTDNNRRALIRYYTGNDEPLDGTVLRVGPTNMLGLKMLDSYWEDLNAQYVYSDSDGIATNGELTIINDGEADCYPIIRIAALASNSDFTLTNTTLRISTRMGTNSFVLGTTIILDSINGTMMLDSGSGSQSNIADALFNGTGHIRFSRGTNTIRYQSIYGSVEIEIEYRRRWPF